MPFITLTRADDEEPIAINLDLVDTIQPFITGSSSTVLTLAGQQTGGLQVTESFGVVMREVARLTRPDLAQPNWRYTPERVVEVAVASISGDDTLTDVAVNAARLAREVD